MNSEIKESEVVDTYLQHKKHKHYLHEDCSTCFKENKDKPLFSAIKKNSRKYYSKEMSLYEEAMMFDRLNS